MLSIDMKKEWEAEKNVDMLLFVWILVQVLILSILNNIEQF